MNRKFIYVSLFVAMSTFTLTSCGGSSESEEATTEETKPTEEVADAEEGTEETEKLDVSSLTSADEAMNEYKTMLESYADLVKNGSVDEAEELKAQLEELKSFSEDKWGAASLKAMTDLSKFALQIESGKDVNLDDAYDAYDKSMEAIKNMPGMDAETEKAMEASQDAMKNLKNMGL